MQEPHITLEQWRALAAVVEYGGYAQAAQRLHRSQSTLSYAVAKLQDQLGVTLLEVRGRKAQLTEQGEALLRRARQLLKDALEIEQLAANLGRGWEPEIRLVVDMAFPTAVLTQALKEFAPHSRGTRVQLQEVVLSGADEALLEGRADLVIGNRIPPGFLGDTLLEIEFVAVAHAQHALHQLQRPLEQDDLRHQLQVVIRDSGVQLKRDVGWLGAEQRWTVTGLDTALRLIGDGLGFGWLPRHLVDHNLSTGILKPLPLRVGQTRRDHLYLIFGKNSNIGPATQQLAKIFHSLCAPPAQG